MISSPKAKECGAEYTFNTKREPDYVAKIKEITKGGCHAVVNYTNSLASYETAPDVLRINGILMVVGLPATGLTFNPMFIALRKYRIMGGSNSIPADLPDCINFSAKHNIKSKIAYYPLERIQWMMDEMRQGKFAGRVAVKFD